MIEFVCEPATGVRKYIILTPWSIEACGKIIWNNIFSIYPMLLWAIDINFLTLQVKVQLFAYPSIYNLQSPFVAPAGLVLMRKIWLE